MTQQNYSNVAVETALVSGITSGATSINVSSTVGFPSPNFTLVIDPDTANEELVLVSTVGGGTLTVSRGYDGTTAVAHDAGAVIRHVHSAKDFKDSRDHEAASSGVHSVTGSVVGTSDSQTLTNKSIALGSNTVTGTLAQFSSAVTDADLVGVATTQTLTNKTLTAPAATGDLSGFGGAWTSYTPTVGNVTTSAIAARYSQVGKTVHVSVVITVSAAPTGVVTVTLPVNADTTLGSSGVPVNGVAILHDTSATVNYSGVPMLNSASQVIVSAPGTSGFWNSAAPFASWASGDVLCLAFSYEAD